MQKDTQYTNWYELLGHLIEDTGTKQQIANAVRVKAITLQRWINQESRPRDANMRALQRAIPPAYRQLFQQLVARDMPTFGQKQEQDTSADTELPAEFYTHVLSAHANTPDSLYPQALYDLILQQAIEHMDPERMGMMISIVQCVPPRHDHKVHSLREICGIGTPPWERDTEQHNMFLGSDSLAGSVVSGNRPFNSSDKQSKNTFFPVKWERNEQSAIAHRISRKTYIAGCLLASSIQPNYFTETHRKLIENYANLMALAFEAEQFYAPQDIELYPMPSYEQQEPFFKDFNKRVTDKFVEGRQKNQLVTLHQAQQSVWKDIENDLMQIPMEMP